MNKIQAGQVFDGKYRIEQLLGQGAFGAVYKAFHEGLSRTVAIKILQIELLADADSRSRFLQEAKLLSDLQDPNIVRIYSYGLDDEFRPYLVMEYLEGVPLSSRIASGCTFEAGLLLDVFEQICMGLNTAHQRGIIHRDLKPGNIFLSETSGKVEVKIIDFGLSKSLALDSGIRTRTGLLIGSPEYMSPEACSGARVDARSDLYSLGCILFECVSGLPPFQSENPVGLLYQHINEAVPDIDPEKIKKSPCGIELIIAKAMEKSREKRFQSAQEFLDALRVSRGGDRAALQKILGIETPTSAAGLNVPVLLSALVFLAGLLAAAMYFMSPASRQPGLARLPVHERKSRIKGVSVSNELRRLANLQQSCHSDAFNCGNNSAFKQEESIIRELTSLKAQTKDRGSQLSMLILQANCFNDLGQHDKGYECLQEALQVCRRDGRSYFEEIHIHMVLASCAELLGKSREEEKHIYDCLHLVARFRDDLASDREIPQLSDGSTVVSGIDGSESQVMAMLARRFFQKGQFSKAAELALKSAEAQLHAGVFDGANGSYQLYADSLLAMGQREKAREAMEKFGDSLPGPDKMRRMVDAGAMLGSAYNTMHIYESMSSWCESRKFPELAEKYYAKARETAAKYHLTMTSRK